jgi:hypothetical protein
VLFFGAMAQFWIERLSGNATVKQRLGEALAEYKKRIAGV